MIALDHAASASGRRPARRHWRDRHRRATHDVDEGIERVLHTSGFQRAMVLGKPERDLGERHDEPENDKSG